MTDSDSKVDGQRSTVRQYDCVPLAVAINHFQRFLLLCHLAACSVKS